MSKKQKTVNPFVRERRNNIQILKEYIREHQPITYEKIIAVFMVYGLTSKTIDSYLETLMRAEFIKFEDGNYMMM